MSWCLIGLGSNEGDRGLAITRALEELGRRPTIAVVRRSRLIETAPVGGPPGQGRFLNAAALLETSLSPEGLLATLQKVEGCLGRRRETRWGPRTIDLDLLLFDQLVLSTPFLTIPHPRMAWRRFVLEPAAEIAASMVHPVTGWSIARLWEHLRTARDYVAITGPMEAGRASLSSRLATVAGGRWIVDPCPSFPDGLPPTMPALAAEEAELEALSGREQILAQESPIWRESAPFWVSDFWLDQSLAFFRARLPRDRWGPCLARWEAAARHVVRPKLVVAIEGTAADLRNQPAMPGPTPARWADETLDRVCAAWDWCLGRAEAGPVLRLGDPSTGQAIEEVLAAVEAMRA